MKFKTELKWAVVYIVMTIAWSLLGKLLGFHSERIASNAIFNGFIIVPSFVVYLLALIDKRRRDFRNVMTYKQGLVSGLLLSVFITILGPLMPLISIGLISPELFQNSIEYVVATKQMTPEEAVNQFNMGTFIIQGAIAGPVFGLIFSLICAAIARSSGNRVFGTTVAAE